MNFIKSYISLLLNKFLVSITTIATAILSARLLSQGEFGAIASVIATMGIIIRFSSFGLAQSIQHFGAKDYPTYQGYLVSIIFSLAPVFLITSIIGIYLDDILSGFNIFDNDLIEIYTELKIGLSLMLIHFCLSMYFLGSEQQKKYLLVSILPVLITLICVLIGFFQPNPLQIVILGWKLQLILGGFICIILAFYNIFTNIELQTNLFSRINKLYAYGFKSVLVVTTNFAITRISIVIASAFSLTQVAIFVIGRSFTEILSLIYGALGATLFSSISRQDNDDKAISLFLQTLRISNILFFLFSFLLLLLAKLLIPLIFGEKYITSVIVVYFLMPGVFFNTQQRLCENFLFGMGAQTNILFYQIPNLFLLSFLLFILIPVYGAKGMALATSISYFFSFFSVIFIIYKKYRLKASDFIVLNYTDTETIRSMIKKSKYKLFKK